MPVGDEMLVEIVQAIVIPFELREELLERPDGHAGRERNGLDVLAGQVLHQAQHIGQEVLERRFMKALTEWFGHLPQRRLQ